VEEDLEKFRLEDWGRTSQETVKPDVRGLCSGNENWTELAKSGYDRSCWCYRS
jgi:hypothetical protein